MKTKISISRMGTRGSAALIIIGLLLLAAGIVLFINSTRLPPDAAECKAVITGFVEDEENRVQSKTTVVSFTAEGKRYDGVELGQYQSSWKEGDVIDVLYSRHDPTKIWTRSTEYGGPVFMVLSLPFLGIGIYKIIQFARIKVKKRRSENDSDDDDDDVKLTEETEKKFKRSTVIIPLSAGVPLTLIGIFLFSLELPMIVPIIITVLGSAALIAGIISLINYFKNYYEK